MATTMDEAVVADERREVMETERATPPGGVFLLQPVVTPVFCREKFSEEQQEIGRMVRELARDRILPRRAELSSLNRELSLDLMREAANLGLAGVDVPERYGGLELGKATSALVAEALAAGGSASWVVTYSCHVGIGTLPIVFFGNEDQKRRYLPKLITVEYLGAFALTEPNSGSDVLQLATTARLSEDGQSYLLNGAKQFVTNGGWADLFVVFADLEGHGITAFLMERQTPGLGVGSEERKMGIKGSSTVSLTLDDARVPKENLLGVPGDGLSVALKSLNIGRFMLGAADLGGCRMVIDQAVAYALERRQFGQPVAFFEAVRRKFADMVVRTCLLDSAVYCTVGLMDERISSLDAADSAFPRRAAEAIEDYAIEASICKILGSETMFRVADHGVQIYGGYGFSEEYPMAEALRDSRIDRLFEGTNEINRLVVYGYFLKKALMEEIPLRQAAHGWLRPELPQQGGPYGWEVEALERARRLIVKCLFEAVSLYGQDLRHAQLVGEDLADLAGGYYAVSSALNRILQLDESRRRDRVYRALARLAVSCFLEDSWRLLYRLRATLFRGPFGSRMTDAFDRELQLLHLPFDPVAEVHVLTDDLFDRGSYRF